MRTARCEWCGRRYRLAESLGGVLRHHKAGDLHRPNRVCPGAGLLPKASTIQGVPK